MFYLVLSTFLTSIQVSRLPPLSANDITKLVNATDPLKNLDPSIPTSHLSKILIPRVCASFIRKRLSFETNFVVSGSGNGK